MRRSPHALSCCLTLLLALPAAAQVAPEPAAPDPVIYSGALCYYQVRRSWAMEEIAKERKYARFGGVVDLRRIHTAQRVIRVMDEKTETLSAKMREAAIRPLSCSGDVRTLALCVHQRRRGAKEDGACSTDRAEALIQAFYEVDQATPFG